MKLKRVWKKGLSSLLVATIILSATPSNSIAAKFKDVPKTHWANKYVEKMADLGFLQGRGDGLFDPKSNLTFMESMAALSRLTKPTSLEKERAISQYGSLMKELNVKQAWEREALSVALYRNIVSENEVRNASKQNIFNKPIQKVATSVFLAKAMGLEAKADSLPAVFIDYKDVTDIDPALRKYIKVLVDAKVLDEKGDGTGMFNPKQPLRREILSTMLYRANDYLVKNPIKTEEVKPIENKVESLRGSIDRVTNEIGRKFLVVRDRNSKEESFLINNNTSIRINGKRASESDLVKGQEVVLEYNTRDKGLVSIEIDAKEDNIQGEIESIVFDKKELIFKESIRGRTETKTLKLSPDLKIKRNGKSVNERALKSGDYASLELLGNLVVGIDAKSSVIDLEGTIKEIEENSDREVILKIEVDKDQLLEIATDSKTKVRRDREDVSPRQLRETDELEFTAKYDVKKNIYLAEDISASVVTNTVEGYVVQITNRLNKNPLVTIKNKKNNKEESYELTTNAYIKVDGKRANSLPNNPGYEVELYIEGGRDITEAYVESTSMETSIIGKITYIDTRDDYLELEIHNLGEDITKKTIKVYVEYETIIRDKKLEEIRLRNLYEGDFVNVIGVHKGANFVADTIQLR